MKNCFLAIATALILGLTSSNAVSAPIETVITDVPAAFSATAVSTNGLLLNLFGSTTTFVDPNGVPWDYTLTVTETPATLGGIDRVRVDWDVQHTLGPHASDILPGTEVSMTIIFDALGIGTATIVNGPFSVRHADDDGPTIHTDIFNLTITGSAIQIPVPLPGGLFALRNVITSYSIAYTANHISTPVPELSTWAVSTLGALCVLSWRKRKFLFSQATMLTR